MCTYTEPDWEDVIEPANLARKIAAIASESLVTDILVLDIQQLSTISEYFVIGSAGNPRHLRAVTERIVRDLKDAGVQPLRVEGQPETGWIVLDYGSIIVHMFTDEQRAFYRLEELWSGAQRLLMIQ
jgi:ribosome-associated protein